MNLKQFETLQKVSDAKVDALFATWDFDKGLPPLPEEDLGSLKMQLFNAKMSDCKEDVRSIKREIRTYKRQHKLGLWTKIFLVITLLPALANANGQLFKPGFIVDVADERNVEGHKTTIMDDKSIRASNKAVKTLIPQYAPKQRPVSLGSIVIPQKEITLADADRILKRGK